jgi:uncharacterized membrane protein
MIHTDRPKIKVPFTPFDMIIECMSVLLIIGIWAHLIVAYGDLPETVPSHFDASGKADGYSKKAFVFFIPILTTVMYIGLFILSKYPHLHNYMINITEENAPRQYRFAVRTLRILNFLVVLMFAYINYQILKGAVSGTTDIGMGFLITVIAASIVLPLIMLYFQKKLK